MTTIETPSSRWRSARDQPQSSIVPPGRRFQVSYAMPERRQRCWYWPDAAGGIVTDRGFNRFDVPEVVRAYAAQQAR